MQYEYKVIYNCKKSNFENLGLNGWRLVAVEDRRYYFVREVPEETPETKLARLSGETGGL